MKTREESLNNFCSLIDKLMSSKYLLASASVFEVVTAINSSKLLSNMFEYFTDGFDFEEALTEAFYMQDGEKFFKLPISSGEVLALVYTLLKEINYKRLQLSDLLDFFDSGKNYEISYQKFAQEVLLPFKSYVYQVAMQLIDGTESVESTEVLEPIVDENLILEDNSKELIETDKNAEFATLRRLLDLDKLSIAQSKLSSDDKEELRYVLNILEEEIKGGNAEKIKLSYLAYYYAMRPYKKVKNNLKTITEILINLELL